MRDKMKRLECRREIMRTQRKRRRKMVVKSSTKHIGGVPFQERTLPNSKHQAQGHFVAKDAIPLEASWSTLLWRPRSITATTWMAWGNSKQEMAFQMGRPLFLSFLASPVFKKKWSVQIPIVAVWLGRLGVAHAAMWWKIPQCLWRGPPRRAKKICWSCAADAVLSFVHWSRQGRALGKQAPDSLMDGWQKKGTHGSRQK